MNKYLKFSLIIIAAPLFALSLVESYWVFDPYVDTKFSANFNEAAFEQVSVGTSVEEVLAKLGNPIWKLGCDGCWESDFYEADGVLEVPSDPKCNLPCNAEIQRWQFSDDIACAWWDFAWREFSLEIRNGKVAEKFVLWRHD